MFTLHLGNKDYVIFVIFVQVSHRVKKRIFFRFQLQPRQQQQSRLQDPFPPRRPYLNLSLKRRSSSPTNVSRALTRRQWSGSSRRRAAVSSAKTFPSSPETSSSVAASARTPSILIASNSKKVPTMIRGSVKIVRQVTNAFLTVKFVDPSSLCHTFQMWHLCM